MDDLLPDLLTLSLPSISYRCQQETERFWQQGAYLPHYCFELFRRALTDPRRAESKEAWAFLHRYYHRQVMLWVKEHRWFPQTNRPAADLANWALSKMWVVFASSADKFTQFPQDDLDKGLRSLLKFLKLCVHSVVVDAVHAANHHAEQSVDEQATDTPLSAVATIDPDLLASEAFWQCVYERLRNDKERLIIDACYLHDLKPRQVYALYPDRFADLKEVHRIKENILERFRRDAALRLCLEG